VTTAQGKSNSLTAQKQQLAPAFFTIGGGYVAAQHADYTYVGKPGLIAGVTTQPAKPGETILLYGTGFGPTSPPLPSAQLVTTPAVLANSVQVTIGGVPVPHVDYAGLVEAGLYQFNVTVPNVPGGDAAVVAQIAEFRHRRGLNHHSAVGRHRIREGRIPHRLDVQLMRAKAPLKETLRCCFLC